MVLGTTYYNAARSAADSARTRTGPLLAFRNACLAVLALVGAVVAGDPAAPSKKGNTPPGYLPPLASETSEPLPSSLPPAESVQKAPTSVLLPPIQSSPPPSENSSSSPTLPYQLPKNSRLPPPSLLEPPPTVTPPSKPAQETTLEVVIGQTRVLTFPDIPHRVALAVNENDPIASLQEVPHRPREWYLIGKKIGTTFLDVWLPDPTNAVSHRVQHYLVRILAEAAKKEDKIAAQPQPKPQLQPQPQPQKVQARQAQLEPLYQTLEQEINRTFPGSSVRLKVVGEMLVVSGTARNIFEATRILTIARENAPGVHSAEANRNRPAVPSLQTTIDNYAHAGGSRVVNLLRIPGEQQIMLRVVVAEVNRAAARSLGLDFGIGDKQATVLPNRPAAPGSSPVAGNGWIGQILRTLQDLHYAQSLAEPTLTTLNGKVARFQAGGEFPIPVVTPSAQGAVQSVAFRSYGVQLRIQPVVADFDRLRLSVEAEVSGTDPQATAQVAGTAVPGLKIRNFQSTVELREGETLAVAGLIRNPASATLPQNVRAGYVEPTPSDQELVVLISPLLLHPPTNERVGGANPLNPQDIELYLRSRNMLVPRGDALYLIGPQGYAGKNHGG
jgi:pilus assembly protein CpaC